MKRGPKPVDVGRLRFNAWLWAVSLYHLRDGLPGRLIEIKRGPWRTTQPLAELRWDEVGRPEKVRQRILAGQMRYSPIQYRGIETKEDIVVRPTQKALKKATALVSGKNGWRLEPPVLPRPEIWEQLKRARSVADVRQVGRSLRQWGCGPDSEVFYSHAEDFLRAKQLSHYPKSRRGRSDDKRIWFFAKVLAGLTLGIAPATATKRLAHWPSRQPPQFSGQQVPATLSNLLNLADGVVFIQPQKGERK